MKLGIVFILCGIGCLAFSVPYAISDILGGVFHSTQRTLPLGIPPYVGLIGGLAGIILIGVGATRIFK